MMIKQKQFLALLLIFGFFTGCSNSASRVEMADIDPEAAASRALELYDTNGDGQLGDDELTAVPVLLQNTKLYDIDGDGKVSADEISDRILAWLENKVSIRTLGVAISLGNRPLAGATVTFEPEEFMGEEYKVASGTTDSQGYTKIIMNREELPPELRKKYINGIMVGAYKIRITHPSKKIRPVYNEKTTLGADVGSDALGPTLILNLKK